MEIRMYFQMLRKGWWLILLTVLVAVVTSLTISTLSVPQYQATARFIITPNDTLTTSQEVISGLNSLNNRTLVTTFAEVMNSEKIITDSLAALGSDVSIMEFYTYLGVVLPNTTVLEVNVTGPDPEFATNLANTIGSQTIAYMQTVTKIYDMSFLDFAVVPVIPVSPQPLRDLSLAMALGLMSGSILAILSEQIRIPLQAYQERLRLDRVTGVYNRQFFLRLLNEEIAEKPNNVLSVGIIEMTNFKDLLDTLPVASTEKILQIVTDILRREFRGNDIVGRWNEASFVIMLPNTSGESAKKIFERVFNALSAPGLLNQLGEGITLDAHIGGAEYSSQISAGELIEKTEGALDFSRRDNQQPVYIWAIKNPFWVQND